MTTKTQAKKNSFTTKPDVSKSSNVKAEHYVASWPKWKQKAGKEIVTGVKQS